MHAQWCRLMLYQSVYKTKHLLCIRIVIQIQLKNVISNTLILKNCYNNSAQEKNASRFAHGTSLVGIIYI